MFALLCLFPCKIFYNIYIYYGSSYEHKVEPTSNLEVFNFLAQIITNMAVMTMSEIKFL